MRRELLDGDDLFVIHDFLTPEECTQLIDFSEELGFIDAPVTTAQGFQLQKDVRNNERVMHTDWDLAKQLFERAKPFLISPYTGAKAIALNERFRYYRYDVGQRFVPHFDAPFIRNDEEASEFTFMVYLNEGFEGGETIFYGGKFDPYLGKFPKEIRIVPQRGKALAFYHQQLHEGAPVIQGRKYVVRTDVMYFCDEE